MTSHALPSRLFPVPASAVVDTAAALVIADSRGRVICWSTGAQALWGYPRDEIVGRPLADLFGVDGAELRDRDGRELDAEAQLHPLSADEPPLGFLLTAERRTGSTGRPADDELTRWFFEQFPSLLAVYDREARVRKMNGAASRSIGFSEGEVRGRSITEFLEGPEYVSVHERLVRVAETGEPEYLESFVRAPNESRAHAWALEVFPLRDSAHDVRAVGLSILDYSEQYDSRERLALMSEARTRIGGSLDVMGTAREVAEVAVPRFADVASVELLEPVFRGELPGPLPSGPVRMRRAAHGTVSGAFESGAAPNRSTLHALSSPVARCLTTGRAELHAVTASDAALWLEEDPVDADQPPAPGKHSLIAVPILARGTALGAVVFLRRAQLRRPFDRGDLAVTEDLVARAAVCLDNARRFTRERGIALTLQRRLLPHGPTPHPAVETATRYLPAGGEAEVGGDWFDVIPLPGARVGLVVGDVVGHGIHASATMGRLRTAVRTLADIDLPPDELLTHLDDIVTHSADDDNDDCDGDGARASETDQVSGDVGARCLYAVYDPVTGICTLARAGHPAPVLVTPDGNARIIDVPTGPPLGLGSLPFESVEIGIAEGSLLALFTDGLLQGPGRDAEERLDTLRRVLAAGPASSPDAQCDRVLAALNTDSRSDDIALLFARTRVLDRDHVASWELSGDPAAVAETRRQVGERLAEWGLEEAAFTTELVVSELVTNAIRYGTGPILLRLIRDRSLICEVSDGSSTSPHLRRARPSDEGGRGLFLVAELTQRWGTRYTPGGKTIWAEQPVVNG